MKITKFAFFCLIASMTATVGAQDDAAISSPSTLPDTWANWERRLTEAFEDFNPPKVPGTALGIVVPNDTRADLMPLTAFGYEVLEPEKTDTIILLMPAPASYPLNGLVMPGGDGLTTSFGEFHIDQELRADFQNVEYPIFVDDAPFSPELPPILQLQLAAIKYKLQSKSASVKFLPMMVKFKDPNSQSKDLAPYLADQIKALERNGSVRLVVMGNLTQFSSEENMITTDNTWLSAIRNLDMDTVIQLDEQSKEASSNFTLPDRDSLVLGLQLLQSMGGDHSEILTYVHSGQLVLTKNKKKPLSYVVAGVASAPPYPPRVRHMDREKLVEIFDELFRSDILTLTRQTCLSIVDATAAKPPTLIQKEAGKKWPVYVSLFDPDGNLAGEGGSHVGKVPLEEGLRQYSFDAMQQAKPKVNKENISKYVLEISIPYGFSKLNSADELIPMLNGLVVRARHKAYGFHPNSWRKYPHPHQLLSAICYKLGLKPWDYTTRHADIESFRILAFNEKEPFQDLGAPARKKKKKGKAKESDTGADEGDEGDDEGGGGGDFSF